MKKTELPQILTRKRKARIFGRIPQLANLALADLWHEWRLSLCLVLAVAAIATPLLLFFGLKNGTVNTLRSRLLDNPVNVEILPNTEKLLSTQWFEKWRNDARVAFVVPHTRKLSAQAEFYPKESINNIKYFDIRSTGENDILLERYGSVIPQENECVLTYKAANSMGGVAIGDTLTCLVSRAQGREKAEHDFTVVGILPQRAGNLPVAYIPLEQLEAIENYKDGRAVPEFNWDGVEMMSQSALKDLLIITSQPLTAMQTILLQEDTGFAKLKKLNTNLHNGIEWESSQHAFILSALGNLAVEDNILIVQDRLRSIDNILIPLSSDILITFPNAQQALKLSPATAYTEALPSISFSEKLNFKEWSSFNSKPLAELALNPNTMGKWGLAEGLMPITASYTKEEGNAVSFEIKLIADSALPEDQLFAPLSLIGSLNVLQTRSLDVAQNAQGDLQFAPKRMGYSAFRMYASSLENVSPLAKALEEDGIKVNTRADRIEEVLMLDKYISLLFWVIAATSLFGGLACLMANIYANVDRKRKEFAVLRLLGVHGTTLGVFPIVSVMVLTSGGLCLALGIFHIMAYFINNLFASHLEEGEAFCHLAFSQQYTAFILSLGIAFIAGFFAARRLSSIQAAESLRDE